ncbi:MAG: 2-C-methyl-D-erythritol 4-phosphate cytidylyltransferase [Lachnospiraceae bacterium]|nr:2-C-methyl-D-erythritol 4-phosphate cytidylyltransferase [Lachnospiraceae bacterium]MBR6315967.1 2-C-methyl-D-erythritol 4-phosphate cytidylyltransferase [Lachnospiraceae bacterium]MCR5339290.1 2-C-methyl-D-erythritol 4-phosphate cytidylyltransferase [Lachnospiraceae bacterium]
MNIAVIFAGGSGRRMHTKDKPKQFLMVHGKPIIVHTIEKFQYHPAIDGIIVVCIEDWIDYMKEMQYRYRLDKIGKIVPGGGTGQLSIFNGLKAAEEVYGSKDNIVLIHDGVRPLINDELIDANIASVKEHGSAITVTPAKETVILVDDNGLVTDVPSREHSRTAQAPQSFWLSEILNVHRQAVFLMETNAIDSCTLMRRFGKNVSVVVGPNHNIKITTPEDFYIFRALYDAIENEQMG